jgi:hypothetical protein
MKILKSNTNEVFDTGNINLIEVFKGKKPDVPQALHLNTDKTDYEFLKQFFPVEHSIFWDFSESFFYVIP